MLTKLEILNWLKESDLTQLQKLWHMADEVRKKNVGDEVHLRGLLEISNYCARSCAYCGLNVQNNALERYRMTADEILECAKQVVQFGYGTVVMQAGEDYGIQADWLAAIIRKIKQETPLAITLSLGERPVEDLKAWREAGADRYLLRFETSDSDLYKKIHPPLKVSEKENQRFEILNTLKQLGYEVGSGVMIGIPGQTYETLANDILLFSTLDLDMIGVGPYIVNPKTDLGSEKIESNLPKSEQVPNSELMTYKVLALTRLVCPDANIPSTTALATINTATGRENGLMRGANVVMPNVTPIKYREKYEIYPGKACQHEAASACNQCIKRRIMSLGRGIGKGQGNRVKHA